MKRTSLAVLVMLGGCGELVEPSKAVSTMESAGYTDVRVIAQHGVAAEWAGCSKGDAVGFDVSAKNPAGVRTTALVCCGLVMKGCTIRH